jgi:hypothetical protein
VTAKIGAEKAVAVEQFAIQEGPEADAGARPRLGVRDGGSRGGERAGIETLFLTATPVVRGFRLHLVWVSVRNRLRSSFVGQRAPSSG